MPALRRLQSRQNKPRTTVARTSLSRVQPLFAGVILCCSLGLSDRLASAAGMSLSAEECANLKVLIDDAVFDFENREGAEIKTAKAADSTFESKLLRFEVTGSTAPFSGCQLIALSTQRVSTDRSLSCKLINQDYRGEAYQVDAEASQRYVDLVEQLVAALGACLEAQPAARTWASKLCGDACTRHQYRWRLKLVPPRLDVVVEVEADIPDAGALVGGLNNEFEVDASIRRMGP